MLTSRTFLKNNKKTLSIIVGTGICSLRFMYFMLYDLEELGNG